MLSYDRFVRPSWIVIAALTGRLASADSDKSAPALFEEGRKELAAGHFDVACEKFEESIRKDPRAVGTLLNIGLCNERLGKVATALERFIEAYDRAGEAKLPEMQKAADEHILRLRTQVPFVEVTYTAAALDGETLLIDDRVIRRGAARLTLDPGPHTVVLTAPGRLPYETTVVAKASQIVPLELPLLEVPKRTAIERDSWRRVWGRPAVFGGGGIALLSAGAIVYAKHRYDSQGNDPDGAGPLLPHCGQRPTSGGLVACDDAGKSARDSARVLATGAAVVGVIGLVTLAAGTYLWWSAPERTMVTATIGPHDAGIAIAGTF
ncbi:MAG: hypothetical protein JWO36_3447 [Myxococcales bacterium]|nr:hypothetical protein [Myxococcales bacterium]